MIRLITFGDTKVWLFIQQLYRHKSNDTANLIQENKYLCYYKFSEPTVVAFGELIQEAGSDLPKIFRSVDEAEKFSTAYLAEKFKG
jgi:hypothetical protein